MIEHPDGCAAHNEFGNCVDAEGWVVGWPEYIDRSPGTCYTGHSSGAVPDDEEQPMEAVSVYVVTPSEPTARMVAPLLAAQQYAECGFRFGRVLAVEWMATPPEGFTLPGWEVAVEVNPLITTEPEIRAEDRPRV